MTSSLNNAHQEQNCKAMKNILLPTLINNSALFQKISTTATAITTTTTTATTTKTTTTTATATTHTATTKLF